MTQLAALQDTTRPLVSTLEVDALLELIVQQATDLLQANGGILNLADWEKMEDEVVACNGTMDAFIGIRMGLDKSLSGRVTLHNQPVISNKMMEDPRVAQHLAEEFLGHGLRNGAVAPLTIKDKVFGILVVVDKLQGKSDLNQDDLDLLVGFASQAGLLRMRDYTSMKSAGQTNSGQ